MCKELSNHSDVHQWKKRCGCLWPGYSISSSTLILLFRLLCWLRNQCLSAYTHPFILYSVTLGLRLCKLQFSVANSLQVRLCQQGWRKEQGLSPSSLSITPAMTALSNSSVFLFSLPSSILPLNDQKSVDIEPGKHHLQRPAQSTGKIWSQQCFHL